MLSRDIVAIIVGVVAPRPRLEESPLSDQSVPGARTYVSVRESVKTFRDET